MQGPYSDELLWIIFSKTVGRCAYCDKQLVFSNRGQLGAPGAWEVDHAQPVSRLGAHALPNLLPACVECNRSKSNKTPFEYARGLLGG